MKKKVIILFMVGIFSSLSFLGITVRAEESHSRVSTQYVLYDELSATEKNQVIREQPSLAIQHDNEKIKLVYSKDPNKSDLQVINPQSSSKTNEYLPKAGEKNQVMYWIVGLLIVGLTMILFIWKRKELKIFLVLAIIAAGVSYDTIVEAVETSLPENTDQLLAKDGALYSPVVRVENYNYVGYIHTYSDNDIVMPEGTIVVKYQDIDGNSLATDSILRGKLGETYVAEERTITGYIYKETQGSSQGKYTEEEQTVVFIYEKAEQTGTVSVKYQDIDGNTLAETETLTGTVGTSYSTTEKIIDNYNLKEVQGDKDGRFSKEKQTIIYVYSLNIQDGIIQFVLNDQTEKEVIVWSGGTRKVYPVLYYVWNENDLNSKVDNITYSGKVGSTVDIAATYESLFHPQQIGSSDDDGNPITEGTPIYGVYQDDSGVLQLAPGYYHFYATLDSDVKKPSLYTADDQVINFYIQVLTDS